MEPLRLRGHHLLCLHGFRGFGYSPEFVSNMTAVRDSLIASTREIELLDSPDDICRECPHLTGDECSQGNGEFGKRRMDTAVVRKLGLSPGDRMDSRELFQLVRKRFSTGLEEICADCQWFAQGWCADGIRDGAVYPGPERFGDHSA